MRVVGVLLKLLDVYIKAYLEPSACLTNMNNITLWAKYNRKVGTVRTFDVWVLGSWSLIKNVTEYLSFKQMSTLCCLIKFLFHFKWPKERWKNIQMFL